MAKKTKVKAPAKPLVLTNELGLSELEMAASVAIAKAAPKVVETYKTFKAAQDQFVSRFWQFAHELRQPVALPSLDGKGFLAPMKLNGREITLLVRGLGEPASRASEFKAIAEMDEELYQKAVAMSLGRWDALKVARGTLEITEGEGGELELAPTAKTKKKEPATATAAEYHKAPAPFREAVHALLESHLNVKAHGDDVPYEFSGTTTDGREYQVRIFVDQAPQKK